MGGVGDQVNNGTLLAIRKTIRMFIPLPKVGSGKYILIYTDLFKGFKTL